jgi:hypothetical protein
MKEVREGDQEHPTPNQNPYIQELVLADLQERMAEGKRRYGTLLQGHNGRDMLLDAYDEAMDLLIYLRGLMWERDNPTDEFMEAMKERFPLVQVEPTEPFTCCGRGDC